MLFLFEHVDDFEYQKVVNANPREEAIEKVMVLLNSFDHDDDYYVTPEIIEECYTIIEFEGDIIEYDHNMYSGHMLKGVKYGRYL